MKFHLAAVNQWDAKQWPFPTRTCFAANLEMMAVCPGCGHAEAQLQLLLLGVGFVFVFKWNDPDRHSKQETDLKPSTNPA